MEELKQVTNHDIVFQRITKFIHIGWPDRTSLDPELKQFWDVSNDLHVVDGIMLKDYKLVIPQAWQKHILR